MANNKIGIFCPEQHGDMALATCGLKYKDTHWAGKKVIWFTNLSPEKATFKDMLAFNDAIDEIRPYPVWKSMEDWRDCIDINGHFKSERLHEFEQTKDLDVGYFSAAWCVQPHPQGKYNNVAYVNIPRIIYGMNPSLEWHPYLGFSDEEREKVKDFCLSLPHKKTVLLETQLISAGNFRLPEDVLNNLMQICQRKFGECNFIFASKLNYSFINNHNIVSAAHFTVRQCALIHEHCDLFIGVSSGITMACSCWGNKPVHRAEITHSGIGTAIIANGSIKSVVTDNITLPQMYQGLETATQEVLATI